MEKPKPAGKFSIGLNYAFKGVVTFFKEGRNAKIHLVAAIVAVAAGIYCDLKTAEWFWIAAAIALVFITEMLNTAIELLCDLIMPDYHEKAGKLKDISAGAVLVSVLFALVVAGVVFGNYLFPAD
ncbi:MAG: diacylglycerol kinase family protein [Bacteroidetes bacterium]|nr:diacylglycerol kinase family protein [Bacteroidota bacterium]